MHLDDSVHVAVCKTPQYTSSHRELIGKAFPKKQTDSLDKLEEYDAGRINVARTDGRTAKRRRPSPSSFERMDR